MEDQEEKTGNKWMLDKHVPVVFILAIIIQTATWVWWTATFSAETRARLSYLEHAAAEASKLPERMARQEALMESSNEILREIRDSISKRQRNERGNRDEQTY